MDYPPIEELVERTQQFMIEVFGKKPPHITAVPSDGYSDPSISVDSIEIFWSEETNGYLVSLLHFIPGVRYHRDGSGTPDDWEVEEVGEPHASFDRALVVVAELVARMRAEEFLEYEADQAAMEAEIEWANQEYQDLP